MCSAIHFEDLGGPKTRVQNWSFDAVLKTTAVGCDVSDQRKEKKIEESWQTLKTKTKHRRSPFYTRAPARSDELRQHGG